MLNIDDLLKMVKKTPNIASEESQEKLQIKLSDIKLKELEEQTASLAQKMGLPYINLAGFPVSPDALRLIPSEQAKKFGLICFYRAETEAKLASVRAVDAPLLDFQKQLEKDYELKTEVYLISQHSFDLVYERYAALPKISEVGGDLKITVEKFESLKNTIKTFSDLNREAQKVSTSDLVTLIMASAVQSRASDIHIEAEEQNVKARFRIDGVLVEAAKIEKKYWPQVISRIKLLSGLKINVVNRPQDGRFTIDLVKEKIDVRVSCLPTAYGESVVMRLLRSSAASLNFEDLGLSEKAGGLLEKQMQRPNGMVITTGPTGSGKTTTLYAILNKLNKPDTKIITLEDPIEYHLQGINQSQVDASKDYTFVKGLRSILRQDPDVVMVGEIRDLETAEIALQAALTGHLVISTLHTNDAAGSLPRLLSLGVKPYLLAPAINAVIGQRLLRRLCQNCKKPAVLEEEILEKVKKIISEIPEKSGLKIDFDPANFYQSQGCEQCQGLGYHGRAGIYEVFTMDRDIEKEVLSGELSEYKMRDLAKNQGMITMVQDGLLKAAQGITSVEEVFRVVE